MTLICSNHSVDAYTFTSQTCQHIYCMDHTHSRFVLLIVLAYAADRRLHERIVKIVKRKRGSAGGDSARKPTETELKEGGMTVDKRNILVIMATVDKMGKRIFLRNK